MWKTARLCPTVCWGDRDRPGEREMITKGEREGDVITENEER